MDTEALYRSLKPLLISLAYKMLGSMADAEDIVQDAFVALGQAAPEQVENAKAYLCRIVTNRCIDLLRSAAHRRETYVGPWLPEPVVTEDDPLTRVVQRESLSTAYLLLLQQLSVTERAVFLLREVLEYDYPEIAAIVEKTPANCRQIFRRARQSLGVQERPEISQNAVGLVEQFTRALMSGNVSSLMAVLAQDAVLHADGGGKVKAPLRLVLGANPIARFFAGVLSSTPAEAQLSLTEVNGGPGLIARVGGQPLGAFTFRFAGDAIAEVFLVLNPEKLAHLQLAE